jgi:quinol-cytochrome oxidoreductase complex cytochrome b subunit
MLRDIHRLAGEAMILFAVLHMIRVYLTGSYKGKRAFTWLTGVFLLLITLGLGFSGYLLPWDQLAYWAVTIGTSMAEATPYIGRELNLLLRGAPEIGANGLLRFYLLHVILLPLLGLLFFSVHYYRVSRVHGISLPARIEEGSLPKETVKEAKQRINFIPDIVTHEIFLVCLGLFGLVVATLFSYDAPLEHHADPRQTPLDTEAPWFFLWVQGLLKLGDKTLMGVIIPVLIVVLLLLVPYLDFNPRRMIRHRPIALVIGAIAIIGLILLSYMGTHHYGITIPPATRIVQNLAPEEGIGPLRAVPYDQLALGVYPTSKTDPQTLPPALRPVFVEFEAQINQAMARGDMDQAQGMMIIEAWQAQLKRVTLRILWVEPETEQRKTYEHLIHLHQDRF